MRPEACITKLLIPAVIVSLCPRLSHGALIMNVYDDYTSGSVDGAPFSNWILTCEISEINFRFNGGRQCPPRYVDSMHAIISEVARAIVEEPAPTAMEAAHIERSLGRRTEPHVVVHSWGRF